jgi:hypothetical protein
MLASVTFRLPDGSLEVARPGDLIGRTWAAALRIDDPHVSEAHAMVSLRGEALWLLALRRRFRVEGTAQDAVALRRGLPIELARGLVLTVEDLRLPDEVLGLEGPGLPLQALPGTCGLVFDPHPRLAPGPPRDAAAVFWATDDTWRVRVGTGPVHPLVPDDTFDVAGQAWRVRTVSLRSAGETLTRAGQNDSLHIVSTWDTVHLHRADGEVVVLVGQMARVLAELISVRQPLSWEDLARPHWPHIPDRDRLRRRWDGLLVRLRARLRAAEVRDDLVSSTRIGLVELVLRDGDTVEDRA